MCQIFVRDDDTNYVYRDIATQDSWGNITASSLGNNQIFTYSNYSSRTGQMTNTSARKGFSPIHSWSYEDYDPYGNLLTQVNKTYSGSSTIEMTENFTYDKLHRLTQSRTWGTYVSEANARNINYHFDAVGNIKKKTDFSDNNNTAYQYQANSNKLASVKLKNGNTETYGHDDKGNLTTRNGTREFYYNAMNKPTQINRMSSNVNLYYDAMDMRYKQTRRTNSGAVTTTHYVGKLFEVETTSGQSKYTSYISDVAIKSSTEGLKFTLKDRLGSTTTITNDIASNVTYRNFDAFGKPRKGDGRLITTNSYGARLAYYNDDTTRRGFTDHEHLDEVEIIHMNGRVYDYNVGRFLSVDPFVHGTGSQGINPYSYILNNPLAGTDPSGYKPCSDMLDNHCGDVSFDQVMADNQRSVNFGKEGLGTSLNISNGSVEFVYSKIETEQETADIGSQAANEQVNPRDYVLPEKDREQLHAEINKAIEDNDLTRVFDGDNAEENAALAWANAMNPISIKYKVELGAEIFEDRKNSGNIYLGTTITNYAAGYVFSTNSEKLPLLRYRALATIHSHGRGKIGGSGENFSGRNITKFRGQSRGDMYVAINSYSNAYLATPQGKLKKFTFKDWKPGEKAHTAVTVINSVNVWNGEE